MHEFQKRKKLKTEGLCRRSFDINDYGGYCFKNSGVTEDQCTEYCANTADCVAANHYQDDKCDLFLKNR